MHHVACCLVYGRVQFLLGFARIISLRETRDSLMEVICMHDTLLTTAFLILITHLKSFPLHKFINTYVVITRLESEFECGNPTSIGFRFYMACHQLVSLMFDWQQVVCVNRCYA